MITRPQTKRCPHCKQPRRETEFAKRPDGTRYGICGGCMSRQRAARGRQAWTWHMAMAKTANQAIYGSERVRRAITPEVIRAVFELQDGKCAVTRAPFSVPEGSELTVGVGWHQIRDLCGRPNHTPELVRADGALPWEPGNLALVVAPIVGLCRATDSLYAVQQLCRDVADAMLQIPDNTSIAMRLHDYATKRTS